ncbi:MAG: hypothetical protein AAFX06_23035, partial [Planctomycetota bacterium]
KETSAVRSVSYESIGGFELPSDDRGDIPPKANPGMELPPATITPSKPTVAAPVEPDLSIDQSSVHRFTTRIQPILLNRCSGCHSESSPHQTEFELLMPRSAKWAPKRAAQQNLAAVLKFLDRNRPLESAIRARAIDGHGGRRKSLSEAMLVNLDAWLGGLRAQSSRTTISESPALQPSQPPPLTPWDEDLPSDAIPNSDAMSNERPKTRRIPQVENPFDPAIFNRRYHGTDTQDE